MFKIFLRAKVLPPKILGGIAPPVSTIDSDSFQGLHREFHAGFQHQRWRYGMETRGFHAHRLLGVATDNWWLKPTRRGLNQQIRK